jgi:hypothetical protein
MSCSRRAPLRELGLAQLCRWQVDVGHTTMQFVILRGHIDELVVLIVPRSSIITLTTRGSPRPIRISYKGATRLLIIT